MEEKITNMEKEISDLKGKVAQQDECNCNLTGLEHDIRQNGIEIARVRHLVVLNDNRISENLDQIDDNKNKINANKVEIEATVETVKLDLETFVNQLQVNLETSIDSVKSDVASNQGNIQSITTDLNVRIFHFRKITLN